MKLWSNIIVVIFQLAMLALVLGAGAHLWLTLHPVERLATWTADDLTSCPRRNWLGQELRESVRIQADAGQWRLRCVYAGSVR